MEFDIVTGIHPIASKWSPGSTVVKGQLDALNRFRAGGGKNNEDRLEEYNLQGKLAKEAKKRWVIEFVFNVEYTPQHRGRWEQMVKELKRSLSKEANPIAKLMYEALATLLIRTKGIINRPPHCPHHRPVSHHTNAAAAASKWSCLWFQVWTLSPAYLQAGTSVHWLLLAALALSQPDSWAAGVDFKRRCVAEMHFWERKSSSIYMTQRSLNRGNIFVFVSIVPGTDYLSKKKGSLVELETNWGNNAGRHLRTKKVQPFFFLFLLSIPCARMIPFVGSCCRKKVWRRGL